jgi:hypothetical protein
LLGHHDQALVEGILSYPVVSSHKEALMFGYAIKSGDRFLNRHRNWRKKPLGEAYVFPPMEAITILGMARAGSLDGKVPEFLVPARYNEKGDKTEPVSFIPAYESGLA